MHGTSLVSPKLRHWLILDLIFCVSVKILSDIKPVRGAKKMLWTAGVVGLWRSVNFVFLCVMPVVCGVFNGQYASYDM